MPIAAIPARPVPTARGALRCGASNPPASNPPASNPPPVDRRGLPPAGAVLGGACRICRGPVSPGYTMCGSCSAVAVALGHPPVPVTPFAVVGPGSPLYRALRQYKSGQPDVARRQGARLAVALAQWWDAHGAQVASDGVDVGTVVPSSAGGRPPPHPLDRVVRAAGPRLPPFARLLDVGSVPVRHRRPSLGAYRVVPPARRVRDRRVLLLDDVYTSGAHLQSAAAALFEAGAASVVGLVIARYVSAAVAAPAPGSAPGGSGPAVPG